LPRRRRQLPSLPYRSLPYRSLPHLCLRLPRPSRLQPPLRRHRVGRLQGLLRQVPRQQLPPQQVMPLRPHQVTHRHRGIRATIVGRTRRPPAKTTINSGARRLTADQTQGRSARRCGLLRARRRPGRIDISANLIRPPGAGNRRRGAPPARKMCCLGDSGPPNCCWNATPADNLLQNGHYA
jgi:hypothetical protein